MAATAPTAVQLELINSLSQDDIPIKLRCAICSRLAVNAFRLPCCEQAICETCQASLPSSCPVCEHTPVAAEDCKPHKSLRTTIKVFLRTEEKKREALRLKEAKDTPPITPSTPIETIIPPAPPPEVALTQSHDTKAAAAEAPLAADLSAAAEKSEQQPHNQNNDTEAPLDDQQDVPQPSIEEIAPGQEQTEEEPTNNEDEDSGKTGSLVNGQNVQPNAPNDMSQTPGFGMGFGFDASTGGFPNMAMMGQGGDFNQMQMMMAMQNGMGPNAFSNFPMMGMPGMTMDPMAMQNMYMNGGFGAQGMGMGMNGMNMGMGMAGFDGGMGAGFNNGWNGQQSWNIGQDNFNHPNASGMGHGDYGSNNPGFQAGYNQGNYGRTNQYNDYQQNAYGQGQYGRGRGRGRGYGYGPNRGGHGYGQNEAHLHQGQQNGFAKTDSESLPTGPTAVVASSAPPDGNVDQYGREIREKTETMDGDDSLDPTSVADVGTNIQDENYAAPKNTVSQKDVQATAGNEEDDTPKPIQTLEQLQRPSHFNGYADHGSMQPPNIPIVKADIPFNAPTGPKAMRAGLPNTSIMHLRARGLSIPDQNGHTQPDLSAETVPTPIRSQSGTPERERERDRSQSRSRSRSPIDERRQKKRSRHRSTSLSDDGKEEERRRERRHRHSRKYEDESEENDRDAASGDIKDKSNGTEPDRSRSQSATESRRSSHRSRRDRDHEREKDRDRDRDRERGDKEHKSSSSSNKHRSSHRSHRDRSRDRDRGDRDRDRERDRSREHRHRRRHDETSETSASKTKDRDVETDYAPQSATSDKAPATAQLVIPSGPRSMTAPKNLTISNAFSAAPVSVNGKPNGIEINIRGSSRRKAEQASDMSPVEPSSAVPVSSRGEERKERDRERDREREKERDQRDRERSNRHREDRDRDRHAHSSSRNERNPSTTNGTDSTSVNIPTGPSASSSSTHSSSHKASQSAREAQPKPPKSAADPHTIEREARNRERLLKEAQRMAGLSALMSGTVGRKRSLAATGEDAGDDGGRRRSRKSRTNSERWEDDRNDEGEEARLARVEREREREGGR